jgi:hypothetical protein
MMTENTPIESMEEMNIPGCDDDDDEVTIIEKEEEGTPNKTHDLIDGFMKRAVKPIRVLDINESFDKSVEVVETGAKPRISAASGGIVFKDN